MDPLSAVTTIAAASHSLGNWVGRSFAAAQARGAADALPAGEAGPRPGARQAGTFAAVLEGPPQPAPSVSQLRERLQRMVDETLAGLGLSPTTPLELAIGGDGRIRLQSQHPRGAEIEAALAARDELASLAAQLTEAAGGTVALAWPSLTTAPGFPYTMR